MRKRSRLDLLVDWKIGAIDRFLGEAYDYFGRRILEAGGADGDWITPEGRLTEPQTLVECQRLVLESSIQELNNLVDSILLALVWRATEEAEPADLAESQRTSRASLEKAIEKRYGCPLRFIPGWDVVERLREQVNAIKHRSGMTLRYRGESGFNEIVTVRVSPEDVRESIRATRNWLVGVIKATEGGQEAV